LKCFRYKSKTPKTPAPMIKKLLSVFAIIAIGTTGAHAQCTPDISCLAASVGYGVCPDSATGLPTGTVGIPYTAVVSFKIPTDTDDFGVPGGTLNNVTVDGVDSLAPGLSYSCSPVSCIFNGGTNGCILISGTPTAVWNKTIIVHATGNATVFGFPLAQPTTNEQYRSVVNAPAGIETLDLSKFDVEQNAPNPFDDKTEIRFSSVDQSNIEFKVFNLLGSVVYSNSFKAEKGVNKIMISAHSFAPGAYIFSVRNGNKTITKRMIVAK
jgi:hypothetical protein